MSEASIGNDPERASVGFTVVNRLKMFGKTAVDQVWSAYAHNQAPTAELVALARQWLAGQRVDITKGATHFYSPRSMPKEGDATGGFDVGGGLELVPPLQVRTFAPSWIKTMQLVEIDGVRPAFYKSLSQGLSVRSCINCSRQLRSPSRTPASVPEAEQFALQAGRRRLRANEGGEN